MVAAKPCTSNDLARHKVRRFNATARKSAATGEDASLKGENF